VRSRQERWRAKGQENRYSGCNNVTSAQKLVPAFAVRAREEAGKSRSYEALAQGFAQSVAGTMSHGQQKQIFFSQFLLHFFFFLFFSPLGVFFFQLPENNFFYPFLNKKESIFLDEIPLFFVKEIGLLLLVSVF
jgi:hypothetical protein